MTYLAAATIGSALIGAYASGSAADAMSSASAQSAALQQQMFEQQRLDQAPWREAGVNALARQQQLMGLGTDQGTGGFGRYARDFGMQDYQADPGYQFRLSEGMKALGNQASARGGLISGQTMKGMQDYAQGSASQEFQNAFNRYQVGRSNQLNPLQSLSGGGQTATTQMGQAGQNFANQMGQNYMGAGQAQASGYLGQAGAVTGGVGSWMNYNQNQNMMNRIWPNTYRSAPGTDIEGGY